MVWGEEPTYQISWGGDQKGEDPYKSPYFTGQYGYLPDFFLPFWL